MKYVIIKATVAGIARVYPFIFPEALTHSEIAVAALRAVRQEFSVPTDVYSAGFCWMGNSEWGVTTGSESLRIEKSREQSHKDERILNQPNALQNMLV